jgi:hypothetical protein
LTTLRIPAETVAHRELPAAPAADALLAEACPLIIAKARVIDLGRGGHAVVEPGRVNEGLDGRARLAHRLGGTVEIRQAVIEPALHRQHPAILRALHHQRALRLGNGADIPAIA